MRPEIQQGILTITLNPAVDLATSVERVVAGPKLYCRKPRIDPGGGGVNVARAIRKLNGSAKALVAVGGVSGHRLLDLLAAEAVPVHPVQIGGETRESFAVTDESDGTQYRFSLPGETRFRVRDIRLQVCRERNAHNFSLPRVFGWLLRKASIYGRHWRPEDRRGAEIGVLCAYWRVILASAPHQAGMAGIRDALSKSLPCARRRAFRHWHGNISRP